MLAEGALGVAEEAGAELPRCQDSYPEQQASHHPKQSPLMATASCQAEVEVEVELCCQRRNLKYVFWWTHTQLVLVEALAGLQGLAGEDGSLQILA